MPVLPKSGYEEFKLKYRVMDATYIPQADTCRRGAKRLTQGLPEMLLFIKYRMQTIQTTVGSLQLMDKSHVVLPKSIIYCIKFL